MPEYEEKILSFTPSNLIPNEYQNYPFIKGAINVAWRLCDEGARYVLSDATKYTLNQIRQVMEEELFEGHPELVTADNQYLRPLVYGSLQELSPDILFCRMFEINKHLQRKKMGTYFQKNLAYVAKKMGYKFLTGYQTDANKARFFIERNRDILEEIQEKRQGEFEVIKEQEPDETVFYTIEFLHAGDREKYLKPERIHASTENKIQFKKEIINKIYTKLKSTGSK